MIALDSECRSLFVTFCRYSRSSDSAGTLNVDHVGILFEIAETLAHVGHRKINDNLLECVDVKVKFDVYASVGASARGSDC